MTDPLDRTLLALLWAAAHPRPVDLYAICCIAWPDRADPMDSPS
jgi:hypothetical protein